jgi:hypothetical protein
MDDAFMVQVQLTKWDPIAGARETIGEAMYQSYDASTTFEKFDLEISYLSEAGPDTLSIFIVNTINQAAALGTVLWADDFEFTYSQQVSLNETASDYFKVYPIPAEDKLFIRSEKGETIQIIDLAGNLIDQHLIQKGIEKVINIESYDQGMYFVKRSNGTTTKFIVTR